MIGLVIYDVFGNELMFPCGSEDVYQKLRHDLLISVFQWTEQNIRDGFKMLSKSDFLCP